MQNSLGSLIEAAGIFIYPLALCAFLAAFIIFERLFALRTSKIIPDELVDASSIDGAGFWGIFRHLILPLSGPPFLVVCIWQFTQIWNEFLFAVTLTKPSSQPITVALANLAGGQAVSWNLPMAGSVLAALPTTIVYVLLGRYFVRGLLAGALKG